MRAAAQVEAVLCGPKFIRSAGRVLSKWPVPEPNNHRLCVPGKKMDRMWQRLQPSN